MTMYYLTVLGERRMKRRYAYGLWGFGLGVTSGLVIALLVG